MIQSFYTGVVENRNDPLRLGRCQVRIIGLHTEDKTQLPTANLPWAIPVSSINSASMSGIGNSATGMVEGTVVIILFADADQQQPYIMGSVAGIPQSPGNVEVSNDDLFTVDDDGNLPNSDIKTDVVTNGKYPSELKLSKEGAALIKKFETRKLVAYRDTNNVYVIGYGNNTVNGFPVIAGQTITIDQAELEFDKYVSAIAEPDVQSTVNVPVTQSMFDSLCSLAYNMGRGRFKKTTIVSELNATNYTNSAAQIVTYTSAEGNTLKGLVTRRNAEMQMFLQNGIPGSSESTQKQDDEPVSQSSPKVNSNSNIGFSDPNGKYPLYKYEPDTNRLARNERIENTIVRKKEIGRLKNIETAGGIKWSQSPSPYNATYPYNQVYQSESGHVFEFDDTKDSERINLYHKSGTFFEIDANGTQVKRIVGDDYEILDRNGNLYIKGNRNVTIDGDCNVKVNNALRLDVSGKTIINVFNDVKMNVSGDFDLLVGGTFNLKADSIHIESDGELDLTSSKTIIETSVLGVNSGLFVSSAYLDLESVPPADKTGLYIPAPMENPNPVELSELHVINRGVIAMMQYEVPDDGDPTEYNKIQIQKGTLDPTETDNSVKKEEQAAPVNVKKPITKGCDLIFATDSFDSSYQLSKSFTLGALTKSGSRPIIAQAGLSIQEIVCNLKGLSENCLDKIQSMFPNMIITSGFRRPGDAKGSSTTSQHNKGQAADIVLNGFNRQQHYDAILRIQQEIPFDQLILEYRGASTVWIHVSHSYNAMRKQIFSMKDDKRISAIGSFTLMS